MGNYNGEPTTYLDRSIPELRGEHMHFTALSGEAEIHVCMSRGEARRMAAKVIRLLDAADREQGVITPFRADKAPPGEH